MPGTRRPRHRLYEVDFARHRHREDPVGPTRKAAWRERFDRSIDEPGDGEAGEADGDRDDHRLADDARLTGDALQGEREADLR